VQSAVYVNTGTHAVSYGIDFYTLGHISKFVLPSAWRDLFRPTEREWSRRRF